jgi:MarR family transcriptional regulator, negative regulator of the multidrug operon emrRAB
MERVSNVEEVRQHATRSRCAGLFVGNVVGAFARALSDKMDKAARDAADLSNSGCYAIVTVGSEPDSSIETLRRMLSLEHSSLVRLISRLEKQGLLKRRRGSGGDQREVRVSLTDAGEHCFTRILEARREILNEIVEQLDDDERFFIIRLMNKLMPSVVDCGDDQHFVCRLCDMEACPQEKCPVNLAYPEYYEEPKEPFRRRVT